MKTISSFLLSLVFILSVRAQSVDFTHLKLSVKFDTLNELVKGQVLLAFRAMDDPDSIYLDGVRMTYDEVLINGFEVDYGTSDKGIWLLPQFTLPDSSAISIRYTCQPRKGIYFIGWQDETQRSRRQIWTQGQGIDHRHWIPHHDDQTDKLLVDLEIGMSEKYQVMANGSLLAKDQLEDGSIKWQYHMDKPMSSYLIALAIGQYKTQPASSASGVPLLPYYYPDREADYPFYYHKNEEIFNFLQDEIAVPYPWANYKQAPVQDFRHGAMENTTATIFGDFFMVDSIAFNDENYTYVNAHELAHQWFGNLVTATGSDEHWLHEGFATYYQWLSEEHLYGKDKADWDRLKAAEMVFEASRRDSIPLGNAKAGSARFYQKGAWVLHMLNHQLGDSLFRLGIKDYLEQYAYGLVDTDSLNKSLLKLSGRDFSDFFDRWVHAAGEPELNIRSERKGKDISFEIQMISMPNPKSPLSLPVLIHKDSDELLLHMEITGDTSFTYEIPFGEPDFWIINPNKNLLAQINEDRDPKDWILMYAQLKDLADRYQVLTSLKSMEIKSKAKFLKSVLVDQKEHYALRSEALQQIISGQDKKAKELLELCLNDSNVQLRKEAIRMVPESWKQSLRPVLLDQLIAPSYSLRADAVHLCVDAEHPENNSWLYTESFDQFPGIPGNKVLVPVLFYRSILYDDTAAREQLVDMTSQSFDFITRINAIMALSRMPDVDPQYAENLIQALLDPNWKLSSTARNELRRIYQDPKWKDRIDLIVEKSRDNWQDFEIRRVQRTFESN